MTAQVPLLRTYGWTAAKARKILGGAIRDKGHDLIVALENDRPVGLAWVVGQGGFARSAYLRLMVVDAAFKRRGIGRRLMKVMEARHFRKNGLMLLVTSTNRGARKFYESLGYRRAGFLKDYVKRGLTEAIYFKPAARKRLKKSS